MAGVAHISKEEAARNFGALMQHIRSGDEVRLDCKDWVTAVLKRADGNQQVNREAAQTSSIFDDEFFTDVAETDKARNAASNQPTFRPRTIAQALETLRRIEETEGLAVPDPDMASDMEEIRALYNQPMDMSRWD